MTEEEKNSRQTLPAAGDMSMPKKPAIVFDFGGVLLEWNPRKLFMKIFNDDPEAVEKFIKDIDFFAWNFEQDKGRPFAEGVAELSERFPHYAEYIKAYDERWGETFYGPIQATVNTLKPLKENGYKLYALTNWSSEKYGYVDNQFEFLQLFETVLVSGREGVAKPDKRFFQMMLDRIGLPAEECVFIDDSLANIAAARQMGFKTIHFESTPQMIAELAQMGINLDKQIV